MNIMSVINPTQMLGVTWHSLKQCTLHAKSLLHGECIAPGVYLQAGTLTVFSVFHCAQRQTSGL